MDLKLVATTSAARQKALLSPDAAQVAKAVQPHIPPSPSLSIAAAAMCRGLLLRAVSGYIKTS